MSAPEDTASFSDEALEDEGCLCDFVEHRTVGAVSFEVHHVIPDGGSHHEPVLECGCGPDIARIHPSSILVADHRELG